MITAIVGTISEESDMPISGNGKTASMTGLSYLDHFFKHKTVWSNYYTTFSEKICGLQEMIDTLGNDPHPDLIICITEIGKCLNSLGSKTKQVIYVENFVRQLRKLEVDMYYDEQRFKTAHLRLRTFTDVILMPEKLHFDNAHCNYNLCKKPHKINVYSYKPYIEKCRITFNMSEVSKLYNSNEFCEDELVLNK